MKELIQEYKNKAKACEGYIDKLKRKIEANRVFNEDLEGIETLRSIGKIADAKLQTYLEIIIDLEELNK